MNNSYMYNYIDILDESLGDGYSYYITDNLPIFNIDGLIETHQYDIRNILTEASNNKGNTLIDKIRMIGKKILSFLQGILEKITSFFKKLRNFIRSKIQKKKSGKGSEEIIDEKEYSRRKRNAKNKNDDDDEVDEGKLNVVRHKDEIAEEKRQEEEKRRQEEEKKKRQEEEKKKRQEEEEEKKKRRREENRDTIEELTKRKEKYSSIEVYRDMDYKGGIAATNKLLDLFKDGFKDYVMRIGEFNNIDSILHSMGIKFQNGKVDRLNDKKDIDRIDEVLKNFDKLIRTSDETIYTNGKINSGSEIKKEVDKLKNIFYGSGEKVNILDFKGTVEKNPQDLLRGIDDRIDKIGNMAQSVCDDMINNSRSFMKQLEDLAKRIEETGEENSSLSSIIYAFANKYVKIINRIISALKSQTTVLKNISMTATNAEISAYKIGSTLDDIKTTDFILKQYESYNDYDGMNWLRDILFE